MVTLGKTKAEKKQGKEKAAKSGRSKDWRGCWEDRLILRLGMLIASVILFLCPDIGSRNRIIRSHKPFQDFISSTEVLYSLPSPMPAY
jgi:hypothetical protein